MAFCETCQRDVPDDDMVNREMCGDCYERSLDRLLDRAKMWDYQDEERPEAGNRPAH